MTYVQQQNQLYFSPHFWKLYGVVRTRARACVCGGATMCTALLLNLSLAKNSCLVLLHFSFKKSYRLSPGVVCCNKWSLQSICVQQVVM